MRGSKEGKMPYRLLFSRSLSIHAADVMHAERVRLLHSNYDI